MQAGDFPMNLQLSPGKVGWHEEDIDLWLESRPRGIAELPNNFKRKSINNNQVERGDAHEY
jgi:hypothetical protein